MTLMRYLSPVLTAGIVIGGSTATFAYSNENQSNMTGAMDSFCTNNSTPPPLTNTFLTADDITLECSNYYQPSSATAQQDYVAQVTPDELPALYTSLIQMSGSQLSNISTHLTTRRQRQFTDTNPVALHNADGSLYHGGNAGSELVAPGRFGFFVSGNQDTGRQDPTNLEAGYDLDNENYTAGFDWQLNSEWLLGLAYGETNNSLEYSQFGDWTDNDSSHALLYASWYRKNFAVDLALGHASGEFATLRHLPDATVTGTTDNTIRYASLSGAFDFNQGALAYGPIAILDYVSGEIDAFAESDNSAWSAAFEAQDVHSLIYSLGAQTSYAASFNWGVLVPFAKALWRYEFKHERNLIVGSFVAANDQQFNIAPDQPDKTWYVASAGVSAVLPYGISAFVSYDNVLRYADTNLYTVAAGLRLEL